MSQRNRLILGLLILAGIAGLVLGLDAIQRRAATQSIPEAAITLAAGSVPVYLDGQLVAGFTPADLEKLKLVVFVDAAEGKSQDGWLLREVLLLYIAEDQFAPETAITVTSTSREKSAQLSWAEVGDAQNMVMFDLSNRGTLKLVSLLEKLDTRDEWVQDVDRIEVVGP